MSTRIMLAQPSHVEDVIKVWEEFMDYHQAKDPFFTRKDGAAADWSDFFMKCIREEDCHALVATDKVRVIGYSLSAIKTHPPVFNDNRYGEIIDLAVSDEYRRQGIGEEMLNIIFEWFRAHDVSRIELRVAVRNKIGYSFWEKHGFMEYLHVLYREF